MTNDRAQRVACIALLDIALEFLARDIAVTVDVHVVKPWAEIEVAAGFRPGNFGGHHEIHISPYGCRRSPAPGVCRGDADDKTAYNKLAAAHDAALFRSLDRNADGSA